MKMKNAIREMVRNVVSLLVFMTVADCVKVTTREEWGSLTSGINTPQLFGAFQRVFIHHTSTAMCLNPAACSERVRDIQKRDVLSGVWTDIRFNFLIGGDGNVYEGTGWERKGKHTANYDSDLGIALIGDFQDEEPPEVMMELTETFITSALLQGKIKRNFGLYAHSDANCVSCPGEALRDAIILWPHYKYNGELTKNC